MENNRKMVPKRRFKEFQNAGDWEQRKLGDIGEIVTGSTPSTKHPEYYSDTGLPWVTPTDIIGNIIDDTALKLSPLGKKIGRVVPSETILVTCIASIGKNTMLDKPCSFNQQINGVIPNNKNYNSYFLLTESYHWSSKMKYEAAAGTMQIVNKNEFSNINTYVPKLPEQEDIGLFFKYIDTLITLHQRKLDKIKAIKKAYLSEMFPQNGEKKPRRRFKGFTDDWEQRKLGDVVQITMGQSPDGNTYSDEPSDYILVQGNSDLQNGWVCPRIWTTQITKKADAGDLIMSVRAPAGAMGKTAYNAVIGRGVTAIKGNEFIYQLLVKMDADGFWKTISCGSTFESLNSDNIKNAEVKIPTTAEQIKIGGYFQQLDNLITLHQRKLEKLKNIKKAYLNEMFV